MTDPLHEDGATAITSVAADGLYRATVPRGEGRRLYLFSRLARSYRLFDWLAIGHRRISAFSPASTDRGMDILFRCPARPNLFATNRRMPAMCHDIRQIENRYSG